MRETKSRFPLGRLLIISGAAFASTSSEFLPVGVLTEISSDLKVSEAQVGVLVSR